MTIDALPTELMRYIFSFLPYWEIQRKRRVNKWWLDIADSVNPNNNDKESKNVALMCRPYILKVENGWMTADWFVSENFKGKQVLYALPSDFAHDGKVVDIMRYLKWDATPFRDNYDRRIKGYFYKGQQYCRCSIDGKDKWACCSILSCHNEPRPCGKCGKHCKDIKCGGHVNKKRRRKILSNSYRSDTGGHVTSTI